MARRPRAVRRTRSARGALRHPMASHQPATRRVGFPAGPTARSSACSTSASQPVVDLVHYGLPAWIDGAYLNPDYPEFVAEYASRVAERFRGRIHTYTPLNEPRVTAWYCGRLGWWPPVRAQLARVRAGHARRVPGHRANGRAPARRRSGDRRRARRRDRPVRGGVARPRMPRPRVRQEIVFLALDLVSGRVRRGHPLFDWLLAHGASCRRPRMVRGHARCARRDRHQPVSAVFAEATGRRRGADCASACATQRGHRRAAGGAVLAALSPAALHQRDGLGRLGRAASRLARRLGARDGARAGARRAARRLHVVAAVRARDVGLSRGPQGAARLPAPDGALGPARRRRRRTRARAHVARGPVPRTRRRRRAEVGGWAPTSRPRPQEVRTMFRSFYLAGFECATGYNMHGEWIDQIAATEHDLHVDADYGASPTSASAPCARRSAGRWSTAAAATTSPRSSRSCAPRSTTAST